jgi:hypothetical protein
MVSCVGVVWCTKTNDTSERGETDRWNLDTKPPMPKEHNEKKRGVVLISGTIEKKMKKCNVTRGQKITMKNEG